ncbi:MAG: 3-isopropylmalate dehydratase large subunit [Candidatus Methanomethylophilaceae archaeon]
MGKTFAEKILSRASSQDAWAGDTVVGQVDLAMSHENAALVSRMFQEMGAKHLWDREKVVLLFDHRVPANTISAAEGHKAVREFASQQQLPHFYNHGEGICHQILPEMGHVRPGMLIVGSDSHTTTYGAFGAFSTGIGATEMAAVWATGELWFRVPDTLRIDIQGPLPEGVMSKDVILGIIGSLGSDGADYLCVEFIGDVVEQMSISSRMVMSNMAIEMGAKAGICFPDEKTWSYLQGRGVQRTPSVLGDEDSACLHMDFPVADLPPLVACPHTVDNVKEVTELEGLPIDQAVLGSCTNGRFEDLAAAESITRGKRIPAGVRFIVVPASKEVYLEAMEAGIIRSLMQSGAIVTNPGCGPCLGAHQGILAAGERAISTTNRNFRGRMGSAEAEVYLASPLTVAASALAGEIRDPREACP